mmetsp:Transcript_7179/g.12881  ORF Transcript_7179/g.12881 Transcript_7179/m.12881 type:complete len:339 (-) Transcript_7179:223-1239(-)
MSFSLFFRFIIGLLLPTLYASFVTKECSHPRLTRSQGNVLFAAPGGSNDDVDLGFLSQLSRRDAVFLSVGAVVYGKLVSDAVRKVARGTDYPEDHERRTRDTFRRALLEAPTKANEPLRILEVGMGTDCRTIRRGIYDQAFQDLMKVSPSLVINGIQLTGVDLDLPKKDIVTKAQEKLASVGGVDKKGHIMFDVQEGDLVKGLSRFKDGHFDCITCSLTLCSVEDQNRALQEIRRLLNPNGGTFGYVEHVSVAEGEGHEILEWQQKNLDPLQQLVAQNCHLHRNTDETIRDAFNTVPSVDSSKSSPNGSAFILQEERFFVEDMWPVSCQCCGVLKRVP